MFKKFWNFINSNEVVCNEQLQDFLVIELVKRGKWAPLKSFEFNETRSMVKLCPTVRTLNNPQISIVNPEDHLVYRQIYIDKYNSYLQELKRFYNSKEWKNP